MADFSVLRDLKQSLIRKPLAGAVLLAPLSTEVPDKFTDTAGALIDLKAAGFESLGHISKEGAPTFTPETETSEVEAWGLLESARTDIISRNTTIKWKGQETHKKNLELYHGRDLSTVKFDAASGETEFTDPTDPSIVYHRAVFLSVDGAGANAIYIIKFAPKLVVTEVDEQGWSQENAVEYGITARAKIDETEGYALKTVFAGPGWKALATKAGFAASTP
ncbi:phage tail tube protein [Nocardia sp. MW-W600-9]